MFVAMCPEPQISQRKGKKSYCNVQSIAPNSFIEYFFAIFARYILYRIVYERNLE